MLTSTHTFVVTVVSANDPPVLAPINGQVALAGAAFTSRPTSDIYQDKLTFRFTGLPAEATLRRASPMARRSSTGRRPRRGGHTTRSRVTVTDNATRHAALDSKTFTLVVRTTTMPRLRPRLAGQPSPKGATLNLPLQATDADGDPLTWTATGPAARRGPRPDRPAAPLDARHSARPAPTR